MNSPLKQNTTTIQDLLNTINSLPEAGTDTSDATASANEILQGETAYVNGEKVTGTIETFDGSYECSGESTGGSGEDVADKVDAYTEKLNTLETAITALETELEGKASGGGNVETCTITTSGNSTICLAYTDTNGQCQSTTDNGQYTCQKNSLIAAADGAFMSGISVSGGEIIGGDDMGGLFYFIKATSDVSVISEED